MGRGWKDFEMPKRLECDEATYTTTYGKFIAEPFERGYGATLGSSLRRVLLSSIEGAAVTSVKINGAMHEFSTIPGVAEDVPQIIANIKKIVLRTHSKNPKSIYLKIEKKGDIAAKDIETGESVEILNPELHIATLTKKTKLEIEMEIGRGRGYVSVERNKKENQTIGVILVDANYTPVKKIIFNTENARIGQITDYDKLILEVWTNGSISPKEALLYASHILQRHLDIFVNFGKLPEEEEEESQTEEERELYEKLRTPVSELELSVRSANCLKEARIKTIGELVKKSEMEMLRYRNFGRKSLSEIGKVLVDMGLTLSMKIDEKKLKGEG